MAVPAVNTLRSALENSIPFLRGTFLDVSGTSQRLQTGGNPRHQMGVCLDILLFAQDWSNVDKSVDWQKEMKLGENLVKVFIDLKETMRWTEIIYEDRLFWEPEYYKQYTQDRAHFTHIHIDWMTNNLKGKKKTKDEVIKNSPQADETGFLGPLSSRLTQLNTQWDNNTLQNVNLASISKKPNPGFDPSGNWRVLVGQWTWIYTFDSDGNVSWRDPFNEKTGKGTWTNIGNRMHFSWVNSKTIETWDLPLNPLDQKGNCKIDKVDYTLRAVKQG